VPWTGARDRDERRKLLEAEKGLDRSFVVQWLLLQGRGGTREADAEGRFQAARKVAEGTADKFLLGMCHAIRGAAAVGMRR
jgi:hypothetical protein